MAQEEAKKQAYRRQQEKNARLQIYKLQWCKKEQELFEDTPKPLINVQMGKQRVMTTAFLDTGADCNLISHDLYQKLAGVALSKIDRKLQTFTGQIIQPMGSCMLDLFANELTCGDNFIVTQEGM